jgi:altronate dehydratase small subunit
MAELRSLFRAPCPGHGMAVNSFANMPCAIQMIAADSVATLLDDCRAGQEITVIGEARGTQLRALEHVAEGHKIALRPMADYENVIKFGTPIGHALRQIPAGAWVHLHNLASSYDKRSQSLDIESGAPTDTVYR